MDAALTTPKPKNLSLAQAGTVGVGFYVRITSSNLLKQHPS
jgi:hypothetical protein